MSATLNRLCKWRSIFAGWQLGTRSGDDAECRAVRDHREGTMMLRAEATTLIRLLIEKKVFTLDEFTKTLDEEAEFLMRAYERKFPGAKATDHGMDLNVALWRETTQGWRP